jgi:hypothetical protein
MGEAKRRKDKLIHQQSEVDMSPIEMFESLMQIMGVEYKKVVNKKGRVLFFFMPGMVKSKGETAVIYGFNPDGSLESLGGFNLPEEDATDVRATPVPETNH